jgi:mannose-1-phosphate guanylyltransferase
MNWAVVLAGGDGTRLQPLTRALTGDNRPKQFCPILGHRTLLGETLGRVAMNAAVTRTLCVVTRDHERYYRQELAHLAPPQIIEQPKNRGTAPAIAYALARIARVDPNAVVGFFPADHYYEDLTTFSRAIGTTFAVARRHPERFFLLGTEPDVPEVEYGWIEAGLRLEAAAPVYRVSRFWEKPHATLAVELMARGCLWNMFVMIGQLSAFRGLLAAAVPDMARTFELFEKLPSNEQLVSQVYDVMAPIDFSRDVVANQTDKVAVVRMPNVGWTDLGQPARVRTLMNRYARPAAALGVAS